MGNTYQVRLSSARSYDESRCERKGLLRKLESGCLWMEERDEGARRKDGRRFGGRLRAGPV